MSYELTSRIEEAIAADPTASFMVKGHIAARIMFPEKDVFFGMELLRANSIEYVRAYVKEKATLAAKALSTRSVGFKKGFQANVLQRWGVAHSKLPEELEEIRLQCIIWRAESLVKRGNAELLTHTSNLAKDPYYAMDWSDSAIQAAARRAIGKIVLELISQLQDPENEHIVHVCEVEERIVCNALNAGLSVGHSSSLSRTSMRMYEAQIWCSFGLLVYDQLNNS